MKPVKICYRVDAFCPKCDSYMFASKNEKTVYCNNYECKKFGKRYKLPVLDLEEV